MSDSAVLVIDASVAIQWVLLDDYEAGRVELIAPALLLAEAASVLSKRCRRRDLTPALAERPFRLLEDRRPVLADDPAHLRLAFSLSLAHQISLWDALYLAPAIERPCDLVTADRRLHRALARHYPFTRLLGETT